MACPFFQMVLLLFLLSSPHLILGKHKELKRGDFPPNPTNLMPSKDEVIEDMTSFKAPNVMWNGFSGKKEPSTSVNADEFTDAVLKNVRKNCDKLGMNEMHPPDMDFSVDDKTVTMTDIVLRNMGNVHRVGKIGTKTTVLDTTWRHAFAVYDMSGDSDVEIDIPEKVSYPDGHAHMSCPYIVMTQVYKFAHTSQQVTLEEFDVDMGECKFSLKNLGEYSDEKSQMAQEIFRKFKDPASKVFTMTFKVLINVGLTAARFATGVPG